MNEINERMNENESGGREVVKDNMTENITTLSSDNCMEEMEISSASY
jgi:hypothetical protein